MRVDPPILASVTLVFLPLVKASGDWDQCLSNVRNGTYGTIGGLDTSGNLVADIRNATAITYRLCLQACRNISASLDWIAFVQQCGAWLIPWLALISQLPFGSESNIVNIESMVLTIGSPVLAAYSLTLTMLNSRWARQRLHTREFGARVVISRTLGALQQASLLVDDRFQNLVPATHPTHRLAWWIELDNRLTLPRSWTIPTATSISWVMVAYIFTVVCSFSGEIHSEFKGQSIGVLWLWLIPIVIGWLLVAPKCDTRILKEAFIHADERLNSIGADDLASDEIAPPLLFLSSGHPSDSDESRTPPIFNYARLFAWSNILENVAQTLDHILASKSTAECAYQDATCRLGQPTEARSHDKLKQVEHFDPHQQKCETGGSLYNTQVWAPNVWKRVFVSSCLSLFLQWSTTSAAVIVVWFTPTIGLGCRSLSFIIYGFLSTCVWSMCLLSSVLSHHASYNSISPARRRSISRILSAGLRRTAKVIAAFNALGLVAICVFQFTRIFNNCYCNSSVFWWASKAYDVIDPSQRDVTRMKHGWLAGQVLAASAVFIFTLALPGNFCLIRRFKYGK